MNGQKPDHFLEMLEFTRAIREALNFEPFEPAAKNLGRVLWEEQLLRALYKMGIEGDPCDWKQFKRTYGNVVVSLSAVSGQRGRPNKKIDSAALKKRRDELRAEAKKNGTPFATIMPKLQKEFGAKESTIRKYLKKSANN